MNTKAQRESKARKHARFVELVAKHLKESRFTKTGTYLVRFSRVFISPFGDAFFNHQRPRIELIVDPSEYAQGPFTVFGRFVAPSLDGLDPMEARLLNERAIAHAVRVIGDGSQIPGCVNPISGKWNHHIGGEDPVDAFIKWRARFDTALLKFTA